MNISNIFFNNGQLNWDAISTISNILLVLALVVITFWYAKKVSEQTKLMIKDRERGKILEEIQDVLTPTIHHLEKEISAIKKSEIFWSKPYEEGMFDGLSKFFYNKIEHTDAFKDIFRKHPDLEGKFLSHDNLYDKLNECYAKMEKEIMTPELKEHLKVLVDKFNQSREEPFKLAKAHLNEPERFFGGYIINNWSPEGRNEPRTDFWKECKEELLKFRNTPRVKELEKEKESILIQFKKLNEEFLENIKEIREKYRKEHNFTKYEIEPELKKFEEELELDFRQ